MFKKGLVVFLIFLSLFINSGCVVLATETKYPDYTQEFLGEDKHENINRKVHNFNLGLNKYIIKPIHILWASLMPQYGMDRIYSATQNIEFPIRLVSSLLQKDFETSKNETVRFFTNTVLGLGGMFDPAKHIFKIEQSKENMEQALSGCKMKSGPYFVLPILSFVSSRGILGKILDVALNPASYIISPVLAFVKAGLMVNKTSFMQPFLSMLESTYADSYDIAKKMFGVETFIKCANLDRVDVTQNLFVKVKEEELVQAEEQVKSANQVKVKKEEKLPNEEKIVKIEVSSEIIPDLLYGGANIDDIATSNFEAKEFKLVPDIKLKGYNPQNPVVDSMRTSLFNVPDVNKSIWNELSIWNRSFAQRIKTSSVNLCEGREDYDFKYILQPNADKEKSPLVIIYPSIGEGVNSSHSVLFAKLFYDAGYSVIIQGSHFQWEFVKSMPATYRPGLPAQDAENLRPLTGKIIEHLSKKYSREFGQKVFIGTSFGALTSLFVAAKESNENTLGDAKFISICPPIELIYAMRQVDKNSEDWNNSPEDFKQKVAETAAKVLQLFDVKNEIDSPINNLPFTEEEGKLITGFIMHQKLSDLVYTMEKSRERKPAEIYSRINNMGYEDYTKHYLLSVEDNSCDDLSYETSLHSIASYLQNNDNYKIYHSMNDYLTNSHQLKKLREYANDKLVLIDNGAHLGFLYRHEFIEDLKNTISLK
ncbi:VacJ family lipoprotein [bacterium]|nr:VacJ family lipoprotein [bacterium]